VKMTGISTASSLDAMIDEIDDHYIVMESAGEVEIARMENISTEDEDTYEDNVRTAYHGASAAREKDPYVIIIGYTDQLAVKDTYQGVRKAGVTVGSDDLVEMPIVDRDGNDKYLWKDIVTGEGWFVSCLYWKDGTDFFRMVPIPEEKCHAVSDSSSRQSMCRLVKIDVSDLPPSTGTIFLNLHWVNRMRGGKSFRENLICVCTRSWWRDKTTAYQNQVMIHEIGHQYGMVADGTGTGPDWVTTQYDNSGHKGSHCHRGISDRADYGGVEGSTCVMFGATNGINAFCSECAGAVKKQDFSGGFGSL